jgi:hypothetical protein
MRNAWDSLAANRTPHSRRRGRHSAASSHATPQPRSADKHYR